MSDENTNTEFELTAAEELAALKTRADRLGVHYHPSIGADKLRAKIAAAMNDEPEQAEPQPEAKQPEAAAAPVETEGQKRKRMKDAAMKLVRIRLTCMNPAKKEWPGEIFTVGNNTVGTVRKFVPFSGADDGWHVPHIMYEQLRDRQCQVFVTVKNKNGVAVRQGKLIKEFAIEVLPPLTPEELAELARQQALAGSIDKA